jgi:hypothetical protein
MIEPAGTFPDLILRRQRSTTRILYAGSDPPPGRGMIEPAGILPDQESPAGPTGPVLFTDKPCHQVIALGHGEPPEQGRALPPGSDPPPGPKKRKA